MATPHTTRSFHLFPDVRMPIPTVDEARLLLRSIVRVLADSNRTADIIVADTIVARAQIEHLVREGYMQSAEGRDLMRDRPDLDDVDVDALRQLPDGTLGRELVRYLDLHGLDFHVGSDIRYPYDDPDLEYVARRIARNHDIWHVLLGLGPAGHEEVLVHAFTLAQVGSPTSIAVVGLGALKHMLLEGRWASARHAVAAAYHLGRRVRPLVPVRWEELFAVPLETVRHTLGIAPIDATGETYAAA